MATFTNNVKYHLISIIFSYPRLNELKKKEKDDDSIRLKTEINEVEKEMENLK